jgi:hypothetical protein
VQHIDQCRTTPEMPWQWWVACPSSRAGRFLGDGNVIDEATEEGAQFVSLMMSLERLLLLQLQSLTAILAETPNWGTTSARLRVRRICSVLRFLGA